MIDRATLLCILWMALLAGCPLYQQDGYVLVSQKTIAGEAGPLHPAVLEYLFATPTGPLRNYYDAALVAGNSKDGKTIGRVEMAADLASLETDARALAGSSPPTGEHYARVRARRMITAANQAFSTKRGVILTCCQAMDRKTGKVIGGPVWLMVMVHQRAGVMHVVGGRFEADYTWDLQNIPNAFDPGKPLEYDAVVRGAIPIHREDDFR